MLYSPRATPEQPSLDERALARALSGRHFTGGAFAAPRSGRSFAVVNPATGEEIGQAAEGDAADDNQRIRLAAIDGGCRYSS